MKMHASARLPDPIGKFSRLLFLATALFGWAAAAHAQFVIQNITYPAGSTMVLEPGQIQANTNVIVPSGANVVYQASTGIQFGPGFQVQAGAIFHASIGAYVAPPTPPANSSSSTTSQASLVVQAVLDTSSGTVDGILVTWIPPPNGAGAIAGYNIFRDGSSTPLNATMLSASTTSYIDKTALVGGRYTYTVVAYDANSVSLESGIAYAPPFTDSPELKLLAPP